MDRRTASSPAMPLCSQMTFSRPSISLSSSSICSRVRCGLRDGCSSVSSVAISVLQSQSHHQHKTCNSTITKGVVHRPGSSRLSGSGRTTLKALLHNHKGSRCMKVMCMRTFPHYTRYAPHCQSGLAKLLARFTVSCDKCNSARTPRHQRGWSRPPGAAGSQTPAGRPSAARCAQPHCPCPSWAPACPQSAIKLLLLQHCKIT